MTEQQTKQLQGLSTAQALQLQQQFGKNELALEKKKNFFYKILKVISEPMMPAAAVPEIGAVSDGAA